MLIAAYISLGVVLTLISFAGIVAGGELVATIYYGLKRWWRERE
jgi:hypothetical protein